MELERDVRALQMQLREALDCVDIEDIYAKRRMASNPLPNDVLLQMAASDPPPQEWFESEAEEQFWIAR